jgi:hypothetical protein
LVASALPCFVLGLFLWNYVVRDIMFLGFFLGMLAAVGAESLSLTGRLGSRTALFVLTAVFIDCASTAVLPIARTDKGFQIEAGRYLQQVAPNRRIVEMWSSRDGGIAASTGPEGTPISFYATVQRTSGNHNMAATLVHNYLETIVNRADRDLRHDGRLSSPTAELLAILNVARVVCFGSFANGCPATFQDTVQEGPLGAVVKIADPSPVVFSRRVIQLAPPSTLDKPLLWDPIFASEPMAARLRDISDFLEQYRAEARIDLPHHTAAALPVRDIPANAVQGEPDESDAEVAINRYEVNLTTVHLGVFSRESGYLQLAHPFFPGLAVFVNGHAVEPLQGSFNLMVLPISAGESEIALSPKITPWTKIAAGLSGVGLIALLVVPAGMAWDGRRASSRATKLPRCAPGPSAGGTL